MKAPPSPPGVAFATPCLTHYVAMEFMSSSLRTDWLLAERGWNRTYLNHCGDQFVGNARSKLAHDFLVNHPLVDNFFFIDDDIGWPPEKVLEFLERDEDILVGAYPKKQDEPDWPVVICGDDGELVERDGLIKCLRGPTGFMRVKRRVLEKMAADAPSFLSVDKNGETMCTPVLFPTGVAADGWFWTEDYAFCQNAGAAGFEIWLDPDIAFTHRGNKAWSGIIKADLPVFRERAKEAHLARQPIPETTGELVEANDGI